MSKTFNSIPQRRAHNHNADWITDFMSRGKRQVSSRKLAINRAKIFTLEEKVRRGEVKPMIIPMGQRRL